MEHLPRIGHDGASLDLAAVRPARALLDKVLLSFREALAKVAPKPSRATTLLHRIKLASNQAAKKSKVELARARRALLGRVKDRPLNVGAARALATSLARRATAARERAVEASTSVMRRAAIGIAEDAADEAGRKLKLKPGQRKLLPADRARIVGAANSVVQSAQDKVPNLQARLRGRLIDALRSPDPKAAVERVLASPLDPERIATTPAWDILNRARSLGTAVAVRRSDRPALRFIAVGGTAGDGRTTRLCRSAHNRTFSVQDVERTGPTFGQFPTDRPAPSGVVLVPPLHPRCRSRLEPAAARVKPKRTRAPRSVRAKAP